MKSIFKEVRKTCPMRTLPGQKKKSYTDTAGKKGGQEITEEKAMLRSRLCKDHRYEDQWFTGLKEPLFVMPVSAEQIHAASVGKVMRPLHR